MEIEELSEEPERSTRVSPSRVAILAVVSLELFGAVGAAGLAIFFFRFGMEQEEHMGNAGMVAGLGSAFIAVFVCFIPALALLLNWRKKWWLQVLPALVTIATVVGDLVH